MVSHLPSGISTRSGVEERRKTERESRDSHPRNPGVVPIEELASIIRRERRTGRQRAPRRVVHCHGVFDLLHIGHIRHLQEAQPLGDLLVVTITPDRFVNKGPHRPAFSEDLRAEALAALECVDYVAINRWPTAVEAIRLLEANVFVKGAVCQSGPRDRCNALDLEHESVESHGGRVVLTDTEMHSASALINRHMNIFSPELSAFLERFRRNHNAEELVEQLQQMRQQRLLVVGDCASAASIVRAVSDFCDRVSLLTGPNDGEATGILQNDSLTGSDRLEMQRRLGEVSCDALEHLLPDHDVVLVADAGNGFITESAVSRLCGGAAFLAVDARADDRASQLTRLPRMDLAISTEAGARTLCGGPKASPGDVARALAKRVGCSRLILARGDAGTICCEADGGACEEVPSFPIGRVGAPAAETALLALTALCAAQGAPVDVLGFIANLALAESAAAAGVGRSVKPSNIYRDIDSILK